MALERARKHLKQYDLDKNIIILDKSSATVQEASEALGITPGEIAKSLSFYVDGKPIIIVTAGDARIDNSKYKSIFHEKAHMIPFEEVEMTIGHAVGGVCPFGINDNVSVYLDVSLKKYDIVYPAAGTSNSAVKLTLEELCTSSLYVDWIDVTK